MSDAIARLFQNKPIEELSSRYLTSEIIADLQRYYFRTTGEGATVDKFRELYFGNPVIVGVDHSSGRDKTVVAVRGKGKSEFVIFDEAGSVHWFDERCTRSEPCLVGTFDRCRLCNPELS